MKTALTSAAALAAIALLGSCAGTDAAQGSESAAAPSSWSLDRSFEEFNAMVGTLDERIAAVQELEDIGSKDVTAYNEACRGYAEALDRAADEALNGAWPSELQGRMDHLALLLKMERKGAIECQNARTYEDVESGLLLARRDSALAARVGIADYFHDRR